MLYKTIVLELLQDRPQMYDQLLSTRKLLPTLESYAMELRTSHLHWKDLILMAKPEKGAAQIVSEAMELAIEELVRNLPSEDPQNEDEPLSLAGAMAFIREHTNPA